ncbi:hypothetical protein K490DRAFT_69163 [Saccharata proteae CBS 121410]|uniref:NADH dehydrogenase [ubiquinone] 1 beta subcomplex subunit 4 n=1 Tax=Saccharata proteae CBS 121410 TaxID=1314787 RepID=A0A9P4HP02_9PEZI|nr:hypothetical protein K490DRAFT_69163 [Saccharata proteae CBS 121410]
MAGEHNTLSMDPALVKYGNINNNRYKYFRWTPRTVWITVAYVFIVPSMLGVVAYTTDGKYNMRGKRRGDIAAEW